MRKRTYNRTTGGDTRTRRAERSVGLCSTLRPESDMDSAYFLETLAGNFMDVVQYNQDNREFEGVA
ncbi:hypothetical protein CRUP_038724, partial [Coryphaenoides rupestris]